MSTTGPQQPAPRATNWKALGLIAMLAAGVVAARFAFAPREPVRRPPDQVWNEMHAEAHRLLAAGALPTAEKIAVGAIPLAIQAFGSTHPTVAESFTTLAMVLNAQGRYAAADEHYARALEMDIRLYGPRSREAAVGAGNYALNLLKQERFAEAKRLFDLAVAIQEQVVGPDHADTALALNNLAVMYDEMDDFEKAQPIHERALAIRIRALGPASRVTAASMQNLAASLRRRLEHDAAPAADRDDVLGRVRRLHRQALAVRERLLGTDHLDVATSLLGLSVTTRLAGDLEEADRLGLQALAIRQERFGPRHVATAGALDNLARIRQAQGIPDEARTYFAFAAQVRESMLGATHHQTLETLERFVDFLMAEKDFAAAEAPCRKLIAGLRGAALQKPADLRAAYDRLLAVLENTDRAKDTEGVRAEAEDAVAAATRRAADAAAAALAREAADRAAVEAQLARPQPPADAARLELTTSGSTTPAATGTKTE
jgi:tetratricopeptide (TPR) repeat protein